MIVDGQHFGESMIVESRIDQWSRTLRDLWHMTVASFDVYDSTLSQLSVSSLALVLSEFDVYAELSYVLEISIVSVRAIERLHVYTKINGMYVSEACS